MTYLIYCTTCNVHVRPNPGTGSVVFQFPLCPQNNSRCVRNRPTVICIQKSYHPRDPFIIQQSCLTITHSGDPRINDNCTSWKCIVYWSTVNLTDRDSNHMWILGVHTHTHTQKLHAVTPTRQLCVEEHEQTSVIQNNRLNRLQYGPHRQPSRFARSTVTCVVIA